MPDTDVIPLTAVTRRRDRKKNERNEKVDQIDFKMVTFSLGGKEYGIDIMKVKEISKAGTFTYVPNSSPFVRGVYNLRGEIISIIDLRVMFNIPVENSDRMSENVLILRLEENTIGVIVDTIEKVVGISSETIQPPHPIFGDINIKYISGVVENNDRLYIILDVERIFGREKAEAEPDMMPTIERIPVEIPETPPGGPASDPENERRLEVSFVTENLRTFCHFFVTPLNVEWVTERIAAWKDERKKSQQEMQLLSAEEADRFMSGFVSPGTDAFWDEEYALEIASLLPEKAGPSLTVWNPGCGQGYETYSLACILRKKYPSARIRIWGNDNDLLKISMAPNLVFDGKNIPGYIREFLVEGRNGQSFNQELKDLIMFEYHDILHSNPLEDLDMILCRDTLSFLQPRDQERFIAECGEKLKLNGLFMPGIHERLTDSARWEPLRGGRAAMYRLNRD